MKFVSLHHHSTYSHLDGYGLPKQHVERAAELGMSAMALTEHGTVSSHPKLEQAAQAIGIKPLYGCELYCNGKEASKKKNHLTVLAESELGYRNLMSIVSWAWGEGFYYEPTVRGHVLARFSKDLVVLSGCSGSLLSTSLVGGKNIDESEASFTRGLDVARKFKDLLGDSYYLETQIFPELENTVKVNMALEEISRRLKIPLVATADVHYTQPKENEIQKILHTVRPGTVRTVEEQEREWNYGVLLTHPRSDKEVYNKLLKAGLSKKAALQAISSTSEIAERCTVVLPKAVPMSFPLPEGFDNAQHVWRTWLKDGWKYRGMDKRSRKEQEKYRERLLYEMNIIERKDFIDYFLIVSDMVRYAKDKGILVGPARGSAAASLVCFLLRITEVDPMLFADLVFERFIDITRQDLPDIDLDFDDERRQEVFDYLTEKYGKEQVGTLGTFITYKSKNSLDDVARVYRIPKWEVDTVKGLLIERSSGDLRASATIEDTMNMFEEAKDVFDRFPDLRHSMQLEGMVKGMSKHAAGAIVSTEPLTNTCAVYGNTISLDKYDAEYLNLLKIDVLGLSTCGMLAEAMQTLDRPITDLYEVPLDDPETLQGFQENDFVGIFQFDGRAMRIVANALKIDNFYEVCIVNALARPGPLHNNAMIDYVDVKHGSAEPEFRHPLFDDIVKGTQHQVVYQEQILRILREIGDFDWTSLMETRKIISRSIGQQAFNRQIGKFLRGAKRKGVPLETAKGIWGLCTTAGAYAFNAAHSVSYGMIAWWTMWLKRHYPIEFYAAALERLPDTKSLELMRDAVRHGLRVLPPDPEISEIGWKIEDERTIRAGFDTIPGIGPKQSAAIVEFRKEVDTELGWPDLLQVKGIGPKTLEKIELWVNQEDPLAVHVLDKKLRRVKKQIENGKLRAENGSRLPVPTHTTPEVPYGRSEDTEVVWVGVINERRLRDLFEINLAKTGEPLDPKEVRDPKLREWMLFYGTEGDDIITLRVDRWKYPRFKNILWSLKLGRDIVLVKGIKQGWIPYRIVDVDEMWVIE